MDTAKMKRLVKMDSLKSYELLQRVKQLAGDALEIQDTLESSFLREQVIEVVEGFYDLGKVIDTYEIFGGYTNRSFQVVVEQNGVTREYFLRKYKFGVSKKEILFEHAMINHTAANGFDLLATVVPASDGDTFVSPAISKNNFAMFHFLEGEDKYSWDNPLMEDGEYESGAEVLASFHNASQGFEQHDMGRLEPIVPGILELIPGYIQSFSDYAKVDRSTKFHTYFTTALQSILSSLKAYRISREDADRMVLNPVHGDYHPGNLKFSGGRVVGVFDLDWAKIDFRLFDVCFALIYNSVYWGGRDDGNMLPDKCALFLKSYQSTLVNTGSLSPLNNIELDNFPTMIAMTNFYLLNWEITDYYFDSDRNDYEYLAYIKHNIRQMHWIDSHIKELAAVADSVRV
jgi:homoserine kinase type II